MTPQGDDRTPGGKVAPEEERFRILYLHYYRRVVHYLTRLGCSLEDSRDLAQEAFIRAFRAIGSFRSDASSAAWLFQIAKNVYFNELRYQRALKRSAVESPLDAFLTAESLPTQSESDPGLDEGNRARFPDLPPVARASLEDVLAQERIRLLSDALLELPPQMRRCVTLRFGQDLKYREIAEVMRLSVDTVKSHLFQARQRLRQELGEHFTEIEVDQARARGHRH
jgi:RNA polymerase sigma-70 factor (ECF subfamily)